MRRAPQLWEQRLARTTSILGAGISSSGDATAIVPPSSPPGAGGGTEPAPVAPAPGLFIAPSTPTLIGSVQGINVVWNGLNSAGDLWPSDTSYVEVHMSTAGTGFNPDASTLKGRLVRPGGLAVVGLTAGTTYHFRLRGADPAGNYTTAGTAASGTPGLINAPDIAANAITANSIVAGTITGWNINAAFLSGGTVSGGLVTGGTITGAVITSTSVAGYLTPGDIGSGGSTTIDGGRITTGTINAARIDAAILRATDVGSGGSTTIDGGRITTGTVAAAHIDVANLTAEKLTSGPFSSRRVVIGEVGVTDAVQFKGASTSNGWVLAHNAIGNNLSLSSTYSGVTFQILPSVDISGGLTVTDSAVFMPGVYTNNTTGIDSVGITTGNRLRRISSSQEIKYDITPLSGALSASVEPDRVSDVATVDPSAILDVAVTEFSVIDEGQPTERRVLGFIADDVADKLPIAVTRYEDGRPAGVLDTSLLAAVLAVVQDQAATITDLRTRIEALEA